MCDMNFAYNDTHDIRCDVHVHSVSWINDLHLFCGMPCILNMTNVQLIPWAPSGWTPGKPSYCACLVWQKFSSSNQKLDWKQMTRIYNTSEQYVYQFKSTEEKKDENIRYIMLARGMFSSLAIEDGRSITITSGFAFILYVR